MISDNLYCVIARSMVGTIYSNIRMISMDLIEGKFLKILFVLDKVVDCSDNDKINDAIGYIEEEVYDFGVEDIDIKAIFSVEPLGKISYFPVILFMRKE